MGGGALGFEEGDGPTVPSQVTRAVGAQRGSKRGRGPRCPTGLLGGGEYLPTEA